MTAKQKRHRLRQRLRRYEEEMDKASLDQESAEYRYHNAERGFNRTNKQLMLLIGKRP